MERVGFEAYVTARGPALVRFAAALCGDPYRGQDLVQGALLSVSGRWWRVSRMDHPDAYVRKAVVRRFLSDRRRRSAGEIVMDRPPEAAGPDRLATVDDRDELARVLTVLGPRQRAVLVLRFYADLPDAQIADVLGCSPATIRSQASRALATLRTRLEADRLEQT